MEPLPVHRAAPQTRPLELVFSNAFRGGPPERRRRLRGSVTPSWAFLLEAVRCGGRRGGGRPVAVFQVEGARQPAGALVPGDVAGGEQGEEQREAEQTAEAAGAQGAG